ncbi:MAG: hypothetical protein R3F30_07245 [Planctomycetota bacterium]
MSYMTRSHRRTAPVRDRAARERWLKWAAIGLLGLQVSGWLGAWLLYLSGWSTMVGSRLSPHARTVFYLGFSLVPPALVLAGGLYCRGADRHDGRCTARSWWAWSAVPNLFFLAMGLDVFWGNWTDNNHWDSNFFLAGVAICFTVLCHLLTLGWFAWLSMAEVWKGRRRVVVPIGACYIVPIIVGWTLFGIRGH